MNIRKVIIENLRQIQVDIIRKSFQHEARHSSLRGQGRVLAILLENSGISRSGLGERLNMSRAAMAELLGKMEKKGLIIRTQSPNDRRRIDIKLTPEGRKAAKSTELAAALLPEMLDCLDADELNQFNSYLERIIEHNRAQDAESRSLSVGEKESARIADSIVESICCECKGPEYCRHDYKKYGHDRPNPDYCKYADQFPF